MGEKSRSTNQKYPASVQDDVEHYEYKRLGIVSLMAGIDLHDGHVHALVRDRHRSQEFIEFLGEIDQRYPDDWKIRLVMDNHSAHVSKETLKWLPDRIVLNLYSLPNTHRG